MALDDLTELPPTTFQFRVGGEDYSLVKDRNGSQLINEATPLAHILPNRDGTFSYDINFTGATLRGPFNTIAEAVRSVINEV